MSSNPEKEAFLNNIATKLGRKRQVEKVAHPKYLHQVAAETLQTKNQEELLAITKATCQTIHTDVIETTASDLPEQLKNRLAMYQNGNVLIAQDDRFQQYGLQAFLENNVPDCNVKIWQAGDENRKINIEMAADTNVGIAFAEFLLAESGTIVVESSPKQGRSFHFLPEKYIAIIPKSKIVPRSTQAARYYDERTKEGKTYGSSINFISGPSNSGDIEMQLVVGVHGPIATTYIIILDR